MAVKVSRIEKEFILKQMLENRLNVELQLSNKRIPAVLEKILPEELVFSFLNTETQLPEVKHSDIYIPFRGARVTCKAPIISLQDKGMRLKMPDFLYRDLDRGFERIDPGAGVSVSFLMEGVEYKLDFPELAESMAAEPPSLNIKFDAQKITNLLKGFREKALSFSSENRIIMFRERKPESIAEKIIAWSGRPLLLPMEDVHSLERSLDSRAYKILKLEEINQFFKSSGEDPLLLSNNFSQYLNGLKKKNIYHELYCPVLFQRYVVGYVYLMRADKQTASFTPNVLEFVLQFSRVLAYSLRQNGYFQAIPIRKKFNRSILVDISGSGLLFSMPLNSPVLELYADLDLLINFPEKKLSLKGRVMRKYQDPDRIYIGVKFLELSPEDHEFLLYRLYGNKSQDPFEENLEPD